MQWGGSETRPYGTKRKPRDSPQDDNVTAAATATATAAATATAKAEAEAKTPARCRRYASEIKSPTLGGNKTAGMGRAQTPWMLGECKFSARIAERRARGSWERVRVFRR